jgi:hypothetical protein
MRLWVFNRSARAAPRSHEEPEWLVRAIAGYALMTGADLGLKTFIKRDRNGTYIVARR